MTKNFDEYVFLSHCIHTNYLTKFFDLEKEENKPVKDNLEISVDGSIVAVKRELVKSYLKDKGDIFKIRAGWAKFPQPKDFKFDNHDKFYEYLSYFIGLDEE